MIYGPAYGSLPYGASAATQSVADVITAISALTPAPDLCYVVKAYPYDFVTSAVVEQILSNTDGPASNNPVPAAGKNRVLNPYSWEVRLPALLTPGALAEPAVGAARFRSSGPIVNDGRDLDAWTSYNWTDRLYEVYVGLTTGSWPDDFALIFKGTTDRLEYSRNELIVRFRDLRRKLDLPIQTTLYAGTGGLEGDDTLKGRQKPRAWGQVRNVQPPLVDPANLRYQLNDGPIQSVQAVRDQGGPLNFDADYADITTATPAAGEYATSLATGFIALGDSPAGTVTVDFQGDDAGGTYVSTVATIVRRIVGTEGGLTDPDDLEVGSFIALDAAAPYTVGIYIGPEERTILSVIDELMDSIQGWALFTPIGLLAVGQITDPATAKLDAALTGSDIKTEGAGATFRREQASAATWRVRLAYKHYYQTIQSDNANAGLTEAEKLDLSEPWRWVKADDASLLTDVPSAEAAEITSSAIDTTADAQTEVDRVGVILATERSFHTIELDNLAKLRMFSHLPGQVETITDAVYDLAAGDKRLVAGVTINPEARQSVLTFWG